MNKNRTESTWLRFAESLAIDSVEGAAFAQQLDGSSDLARDVTEERVVHALMCLESQSEFEKEAFVSKCVQRILNDAQSEDGTSRYPIKSSETEVQLPQPRLSTSQQGTIEPTPSHGEELPRGGDGASPAKVEPSVKRPVVVIPAGRKRNKKRQKRSRFVLVAFVGALFLGLSAAIWFALSTTHRSEISNAGSFEPSTESIESDSDQPNTKEGESPTVGMPSHTLADEVSTDELIVSDSPTATAPIDPIVVVPSDPGEQMEPGVVDVDPGVTASPNRTFATVVNRVDWDSDDLSAGQRIGPGTDLVFDRGLGVITFDDGRKVYFQTPLDVKVLDDGQIDVETGRVLVEISGRQNPLDILVGGYCVKVDRGGVLQLQSPHDGQLELHLSRGRATLETEFESGKNRDLALAPGGINQVVANTRTDRQSPTVLLGKGRQKFLGQIGVGEDVWETRSAPEFFQLSNGLNSHGYDFSSAEFRDRWSNAINRLPRQGERGAPNVAHFFQTLFPGKSFHSLTEPEGNGMSFHGMITIDGKTMTFGSKAEYERARAQLKPAGQSFPEQQLHGSNGLVEIFDQKFPFEGRTYQFSPGVSFESFRKQMSKIKQRGKK
jgi:hypothetical protein